MSTALANIEETEEFLEHIQSGIGPLNAAFSVGWTPHHLRRLMADPDFRELVDVANERKIESVEAKAYELAQRGNMRAIELILFCQATDRGWRPPTQRVSVSQQTHVKVEVVQAAKAAVLEAIRTHGVEALQPGGPLDEIEEADIVE